MRYGKLSDSAPSFVEDGGDEEEEGDVQDGFLGDEEEGVGGYGAYNGFGRSRSSSEEEEGDVQSGEGEEGDEEDRRHGPYSPSTNRERRRSGGSSGLFTHDAVPQLSPTDPYPSSNPPKSGAAHAPTAGPAPMPPSLLRMYSTAPDPSTLDTLSTSPRSPRAPEPTHIQLWTPVVRDSAAASPIADSAWI